MLDILVNLIDELEAKSDNDQPLTETAAEIVELLAWCDRVNYDFKTGRRGRRK